jgi:hypothetical protein
MNFKEYFKLQEERADARADFVHIHNGQKVREINGKFIWKHSVHETLAGAIAWVDECTEGK